MKITILMQDFAGGGAERVMINLANYMIKNNINVNIVVVRDSGPLRNIISENIVVNVLSANRVLFSLLSLIKFIRKNKPDIVLSTLKHVNILNIMACRLSFKDTKSVAREACYIMDGGYKNFHTKISEKLMKITYPMADLIISVSDGVKESLIKSVGIDDKKIVVLNNPTIATRKTKINENLDLLDWFNKSDSIQYLVLAIGRLSYQKDFSTLVKAFSYCSTKVNAKLLILGEGKDRKNIEKNINNLNIKQSVLLGGFVDNIDEFMKKTDLFVLSSRFEGSPNTLIEALSFGTNVVSTDCPSGPRQILDNGKYGKLVSVGDDKALADAMIESLHNKIDEDVLIESVSKYKIDTASKRYIECLQSI